MESRNGANREVFSPLDASKLTVSSSDNLLPIPPASEASTRTHTDHMLTVNWTATHGWSAPQILPYANIPLPPTANVLQYATSCFEGMKLYRTYDGQLRLFRPSENCRRMLDSATRISLPTFEPSELKTLIKTLCHIDGQRWLPKDSAKGTCLYIRPTMIGIDADLGFHVPQEVLLYAVITHWPSSTALPRVEEAKAESFGLKLWASTGQWVRAWPGGSGHAKLAANYGPALMAHSEAKKRGCDQVLWLFGDDGKVTEAGATNFFVIWKGEGGKIELVTPPLDSGLVLPGTTRQSVLELAQKRFDQSRTWNLDGSIVSTAKTDVVEKDFTILEVTKAAKEGRLLGAFAAGTAFFVNPVSQIYVADQRINVEVDAVPHAALLKSWLTEIMYGPESDKWTELVEG